MKFAKITSLFLFCLFFTGLSSCKRPGDVIAGNCDEYSNDYSAKVQAFSSAPSKASCTALVASLDKLVNKCTLLTPAQRQQYNQSLADINCSAF